MIGPLVRHEFRISLDDGILMVVCRSGVVIGPGELDVLANTITHFPNWHRTPILVNLNRVRHITSPARQMLLAYRHLGPIALTGGDPVDRVLAAFIAQSLSSTRYFLEADEAHAWLAAAPQTSADAEVHTH